jgi:hypothetical protein
MIVVNIDKAKNIAHEVRRAKRAEEFAPLDVQATVPHLAAEAEAKRQEVRDKYSVIQNQIDSTSDMNQLTEIVKGMQ